MQPNTIASILGKTRDIIKRSEYCFFITVGEKGNPTARLMQPYEPEEDLTIWFGAHPNSRKVHQLKKNDHVGIAFLDPNTAGYVSLSGNASVVTDLSARQKYWRAHWTDIYPGGPDGDEYILIKFQPRRLEMMTYAHKAIPEPYGMKPNVLIHEDVGWKALTDFELY